MTRTVVIGLAFAGGVAAGLLFADWYAKNKAAGAVNGVLDWFGASDATKAAVDQVAVPVLVG